MPLETPPDPIDNGRRNFLRKTAGVVLLAAGGTALLSDLIGDTEGIQEGKDAFNPETYEPPEEGVIIQPHIVSPDARTVIYIPDMHAPAQMETGNLEQLPSPAFTLQTQKEIYRIAQTLLQYTGEIPFVQENWPIGMTVQDVQQFPMITGMPNEQTYKILRTIAREQDKNMRRRIAEKYIGESNVPAGQLFLMAHQERVIPLGGTTREDLVRSESIFSKWMGTLAALQGSDSPLLCPEESALRVSEAAQLFLRGQTSQRVKNCYCQTLNTGKVFYDIYVQDRQVWAPEREIGQALSYEGQAKFILVIAGVNHLSKSIELMRDNENVNYLVVSPKSIEAIARAAIVEPISGGNVFPDEPASCRQNP